MNVRDPLLNPLIFISYCYHERVQDNKEFNLGNSKPCCESQIMTQIKHWTISIFIWVHFQEKSMTKFLKIKKKPYLGVTFAQRKLFLKNLVIYSCRGPPAFICQRYGVDWPSNQKLFHYYQHAGTVQSICSIHQIICDIHLI